MAEMKKCAICGTNFSPWHAWQRYCSKKCKQVAYWQRRVLRIPKPEAACRE